MVVGEFGDALKDADLILLGNPPEVLLDGLSELDAILGQRDPVA